MANFVKKMVQNYPRIECIKKIIDEDYTITMVNELRTSSRSFCINFFIAKKSGFLYSAKVH